MYRFLLSPRWTARFALALVAAAAFVGLGIWQAGRARTVTPPLAASAPDAAARPLDAVLTAGGNPGAVGVAAAGRLVTATGTWDAAGQARVAGRVVAGRTGSWLVTPLRRSSGRAVLVVRGFVPDGSPVPAPPAGTVRVQGWLGRSEALPDVSGSPAADVVPAVSAAVFVNRVAYPLVDGFVGQTAAGPAGPATAASSGTPATAGRGLVPVPLPGGTTGTVHWAWQSLGYAVQWNLFAVGAFVVFGIAARQEAREGRTRELSERGVTEVTFAP